jgi:hypothetical protein
VTNNQKMCSLFPWQHGISYLFRTWIIFHGLPDFFYRKTDSEFVFKPEHFIPIYRWRLPIYQIPTRKHVSTFRNFTRDKFLLGQLSCLLTNYVCPGLARLGFCYIFHYFFSYFPQIAQIFIFQKRLPIDKIFSPNYFHQTS